MIVVAALGVMSVASGVTTEARAADLWGIEGERAVVLKGRVVDLLCEVGGQCAPDCGGGRRQLGLVDASGRLYPAAKGNTLFAGAVADLAPYCGREVEVDGLVIESARMPLLFVQTLKAPGDTAFQPAEAFGKAFEAAYGKAEEWYRAHPAVKEAIAENGVFGIKGLEPKP